jgi:hypothetical protein
MGIGSAAFSGVQVRTGRSGRRSFSIQARVLIWLAAGVMAWGGVAGLALSVAALARGMAGQA